MLHYFLLILFICITLPAEAAKLAEKVHHQLQVALDPYQGNLSVRDTISIPSPVTRLSLRLHAGLTLKLTPGNARIIDTRSIDAVVPVKQYSIQFTQPSQTLHLEYLGKIFHQLKSKSDNYAGGRNSTPGLISADGVFLGGSSYWYPQLADYLQSFSLAVSLPEGWTSVSQGTAEKTNHWSELQPQDDIYLIAAPFHISLRDTQIAQAQVFLRQADDKLAQRYLDATETYLTLFQSMLGKYPYTKFAVVENFWETGYGMPSFTLLGPRVIRLPFILYSSYPHEILHNWWGNSVYIDYASGNWAEGLTSYLADHLVQEQKGKGADYRRNSLQKYADYVATTDDFPLTEFTAHHGQMSQAVGYGKALMMFHMLRKRLGDAVFLASLRRFYQDNKFQFASYKDLQQAFEQESNSVLSDFFTQWTTRKGAPTLALDNISVIREKDVWRLQGKLLQIQSNPVYALDIPLFVQLRNHAEAMAFNLHMDQKSLTFDFRLPVQPLRISVDPKFEVFRNLLPEELPASLGNLFGASEASVVLPSGASAEWKKSWYDLAADWQLKSTAVKLLWDNQIDSLPQSKAVWIFGKENRFIANVQTAAIPLGLHIQADKLHWQGKEHSLLEHSVALAITNPGNKKSTLGFISAVEDSLPTLARKLPHYGRYSMTMFSGSKAENLLKIQWPLTESPLQVSLGEQGIPPMFIPPPQPLIQ